MKKTNILKTIAVAALLVGCEISFAQPSNEVSSTQDTSSVQSSE